MANVESNKKLFKKWFKGYVVSDERKNNVNSFLNYLENDTDFFTAPASTKYHLSEEGGLCEHTLNVIKRMFKLCNDEFEKKLGKEAVNKPEFKEKVFLVAALHDLCKANFYEVQEKNVKENGNWIKVPYYSVNNQLPLGHGEKSMYLAMKFFALTDEEAMAIRWHMGFSDCAFKGGCFEMGDAFSKNTFAFLLNVADNMATFIDETKADK